MNLAAGLCILLTATLLPPRAAFAAPSSVSTPDPSPTGSAESNPAASRKSSGTQKQLELPPGIVVSKPPTAPPALSVRKHNDPFGCKRAYTHLRKSYFCDSHLDWDGESLRPILSGVPDALSELNDYQATRRSVRKLAYVGGAGFTLAALAYLGSGFFQGENLVVIRNVTTLTGVAIGAGSFIYGYSVLQSNEQRLGRAVQFHNRARPDQPIELQFSTGVSF